MTSIYQRSLALLRKVSTDAGFTAAPAVQDNYYRVWTRDAIVCGIACITTQEHDLHDTFQHSLNTIWQYQHKTGFLPGNITPGTQTPGYGNSAGRTDNTCWGIIGACLYTQVTGNTAFLQALENKIEQAFHVLDAWEYNGKHLLYVPQSGDWADEYIQHGYILFDQVLRYWALQLAAGMLNNAAYAEKAKQVKQAIELNFFYRPGNEQWYSAQLLRFKETAPRGFWWMGFNPAQLYPQFDLQANALALLLKLGTTEQQQQTIDQLGVLMKEYTGLLPSFSKAIEYTEPLMSELINNYAYRFRNRPHEFHNGGLWPVWNGWAAASLWGYDAHQYKNLLERMNAVMENEQEGFNECFHAQTHAPCGVTDCAWGAAGYIIAHNADTFNKMLQL